MTGKGVEGIKEKFANIVVQAVKQIEDYGKINLDNIKIEKMKGESLKDTELVSGIVLDAEKINIEMPSNIDNAKSIKRFSHRFEELLVLMETGDKTAFIEVFEKVSTWFGDYAEQFLDESSDMLISTNEALARNKKP